jgi:phosphate transport system substrate-binding protein
MNNNVISTNKRMQSDRRTVISGLAALLCAGLIPKVGLARANAAKVSLRGAGATLAAPLFQAWGRRWMADTDGELSYASVGSTQGLALFRDRDLDFVATEIPFLDDETVKDHLVQFPVAQAAIVLDARLPGVSDAVRLTPALVAAVYSGQVRHWRHPEIVRLNSSLTLPDLSITPVSRLGSSGSTYTLTRYLTVNDPSWADEFGMTDRAVWNYGLLAKGAAEIREVVSATPGAIGYWLLDPVSGHEAVNIHLGNPEQGFIAPPQDPSSLGQWPLVSTVYALFAAQKQLSNPTTTPALPFFQRALTQ